MDLGLSGRTAIVTGATSGIGMEIAREFASEGVNLVLTYHELRESAEEMAKRLEAEHRVRVVVIDHRLGDLQSSKDVVSCAMTAFSRIDVLVNNTVRFGARASRGSDFESIEEDAWRTVFRANAEGAIQLSRLVAPAMYEEGWGRIAHIGSRVASAGMAGNEYYAAAKSAMTGFSRSLAFSLGAKGDILTNVIEPGFIRTARNAGTGERMEEALKAHVPIKRLLEGDEVARVVLFLCSQANTGITGQVIEVAGGQ